MVVLLVVVGVLYAFSTITALTREDMIQPALTGFLSAAITVLGLMTIVFFVARAIRRYDLVDAAWGWAFMTAALVSYLMQPGDITQLDVQLLVTTLVFVWGIRLSWHIMRRIKSTDVEDPRYVELRKKWRGNMALNIFTRVYMVQAVLATIISIPVIHINIFATEEWTVWTLTGLIVWIVGFTWEAIGDRQLRTFLAEPANKGKIMTQGLWKYSRHPNYFGELTQWWGIFIICLGVQAGWVGIIGPALISYLILFVSGIPLNEKRFEGRPGWKAYKNRTSALIPMRPR